jgi:hypothetical protein
MINGVLIERTVKDVVPALKTNSEGLSKVLEDLVKQYKAKQEEMEKWKVTEKSTPYISLVNSACCGVFWVCPWTHGGQGLTAQIQ